MYIARHMIFNEQCFPFSTATSSNISSSLVCFNSIVSAKPYLMPSTVKPQFSTSVPHLLGSSYHHIVPQQATPVPTPLNASSLHTSSTRCLLILQHIKLVPPFQHVFLLKMSLLLQNHLILPLVMTFNQFPLGQNLLLVLL